MMKEGLNWTFFVCLLMLIVCHISYAGTDDTKECTTYSAKLRSVPDLTHNIVYQARRNKNFFIESVKNTNFERSFYWCELSVKESKDVYKRYRHFGYNETHWWVEKGCGGWFEVTECDLGDVQKLPNLEADNDSSKQVSGSDVSSLNSDTKPSAVDDLYKKWPRLGYHTPTSDVMWDILDKATYVDVPQQLGFYNKHRKPRSVAFD